MKDANRNPLLYNSKTSTILLGSYKKAALEICNFEWRIFFILILSSTNTKQHWGVSKLPFFQKQKKLFFQKYSKLNWGYQSQKYILRVKNKNIFFIFGKTTGNRLFLKKHFFYFCKNKTTVFGKINNVSSNFDTPHCCFIIEGLFITSSTIYTIINFFQIY